MEVKILYQGCSYRQESTKQAEMERRQKYKKQEDEREVIRSSIRDKVGVSCTGQIFKIAIGNIKEFLFLIIEEIYFT